MTAPRVRIAPSPTGPLHIGTARTALFNFLYARHTGGTFILRLEDTDQARGSIAYERDILDGLHWLGLGWDEGPEVAGEAARGPHAPYRQMLRLPLYAEAAERLLAAEMAYPCYCSPEQLDADRKAQEAAKEAPHYVGRCAALTPEERAEREAEGRRGALRFRVGTGIVAFDDIVRGRVEFDVANIGGDFVIVRSDGSPLYHFTVCVDDAEMEISHVVRGEDHLSNTPKHILLFRALGKPVPEFAHLPLILNADRSKMSKRKSQTAVSDYIDQGFIREGLVNYLALLGWATGTEEEVLSLDEIVERFDLTAVHKGGAVFDRERLEWLNGQWIRRLEPDDLVDRLRPFVARELADGRIDRMPSDDELRTLLPVITDRLPVLGAVGDLVGFLWVDELEVDPALIVPKRWDAQTTIEGLTAARGTIADDVGAVSFEADELEPALRALAEARGWKAGDLFMAIRVAITGRTATPPLFDTMVALGHDRTLDRIDRAIASLEGSEPMTHAEVQAWLDRYVDAWLSYDPAAIGELFSADAEYRYHPYDEPEIGRDTIVRDWVDPEGGASTRDAEGTYEAHYEPFAVDGSRAVAIGVSRYYTDPTKTMLEREYRNCYLLEFDGDGRCSSFIEYYMKAPDAAT